MNERSRKMMGLSRRLMAWLLCCVFLVAASPVSATTLEDSTPAAETTVTEQLTEATTAEPVTTSVTEPMTTIQSTTTENVTVDTSSSEPGTTAEAGTPEATTANGEISTTAEGTPEGTTEVTTATEGVSETGKSAAEALYERIMACTTYDEVEEIMSALTEEEMDEFTEEQNAALTAKMAVLGAYAANADAGNDSNQGDQNSSYNTLVVNTNLGNVDAIYFAYHSSGEASDDISFGKVTDGSQIKIEEFNSKYAGGRDKKSGYLLIFVKPNDNYLLTKGKATGNCDIYSISSGEYGNVASYPDIKKIAEQAVALGYVGVLGYSREPGIEIGEQTITFNAVSPDITVTAVSNKTSDVKPGDELTFTVTITPEQIANSDSKVEDVKVQSLTVNGQEVECTKLTPSSDGTHYTTTVKYTATKEDCDSGSVKLNVTAKVDYSNTLGVSDDQSLKSSAYIVKSAETTCLIAPQDSVTYELKYSVPEGIDIAKDNYPNNIKENNKPEDQTKVYKGDTVTVDSQYGKDPVDDTVNRGTWTFDGWYKDGEKVTQFTMGDKRVVLKGTWTFTPYPNADLTIKKTLSGNMYNKSDKFTFTVTYQDSGKTETETVILGKDQTSNKISIPVGAEVTITETKVDKYVLSVASATCGEDEKLEYESTENVITFAMPSNDVSVVIDNKKDVVPDTGVILDTLPYILILAVVIIGGVLLIGRRRSRNDA